MICIYRVTGYEVTQYVYVSFKLFLMGLVTLLSCPS